LKSGVSVEVVLRTKNTSALSQKNEFSYFRCDKLYRALEIRDIMSGNRSFFSVVFGLFIGLSLLTACYIGYPLSETAEPGNPTETSTISTTIQSTKTPTVPPTPIQTPTPQSTIKATADDLDGQVVRFWHPWNGTQGEAMQSLVDSFNQTNDWGIRVEASSFLDLDELWQELAIAQQAKQAPELAAGYLHQILTQDAQSPLVDLNTYLNDPIWGLDLSSQADFYPSFWESDLVDERRLGLPALRTGQVLYYNTTWAEELGFSEPPRTSEEFSKQACAAATANMQDEDPENDGTGGWIISTNQATARGWLGAFNAPIVKDSGSGYNFNNAETEGAFNFLRGLFDQGCAWLPESEYAETDFASRNGLFATGSLSGIPHQDKEFTRLENQDEWTVLPFPGVDGQAVLPVYGPSYSLLPSSEPTQLAAWLFLRWLIEPDNVAKWAQSTDSLPLRSGSMADLQAFYQQFPQWTSILGAIPEGIPEPPFASWSQVRWALQDATTQLFRSYFTIDGVPDMLKLLQDTADELHRMAP
jgi:multiple sugar transport system substrate-binding protein